MLFLLLFLGCRCLELLDLLQQANSTIAECKAKIGTLELKIKVEEFPYQQRVKEMEANLHLYKSKVYDIVNVLTI